MIPADPEACMKCRRRPSVKGGHLCKECQDGMKLKQAVVHAATCAEGLPRQASGTTVALVVLRELRRHGFRVVPLEQAPHPSAADSSPPPEKPDFRNPLQDILAITGATQHRPYTALSQIDQIVRKALAPGGA